MRRARRGIAGPRELSGTSRTWSRNPQCHCSGISYLMDRSRRIVPVAVSANAGSVTNNSTSSCKPTGPCTWASISVSSTRPASQSAGSLRGCGSALRTSSLELIPIHTLREESLCHRRGFDAHPIRMEMDHDTGVYSDTFHRLSVGLGSTSSTLKEVGHAWTHGDFSMRHRAVHM